MSREQVLPVTLVFATLCILYVSTADEYSQTADEYSQTADEYSQARRVVLNAVDSNPCGQCPRWTFRFLQSADSMRELDARRRQANAACGYAFVALKSLPDNEVPVSECKIGTSARCRKRGWASTCTVELHSLVEMNDATGWTKGLQPRRSGRVTYRTLTECAIHVDRNKI